MRSQKWDRLAVPFLGPLATVRSKSFHWNFPVQNGTARRSCFWDRSFPFLVVFGGECILQMGECCDCRCAGWAPPIYSLTWMKLLWDTILEACEALSYGRGRIVQPLLDRASLSDVRGHVSYLASICDDVTVQGCSAKSCWQRTSLHQAGAPQHGGKCPSNVKLWRQEVCLEFPCDLCEGMFAC